MFKAASLSPISTYICAKSNFASWVCCKDCKTRFSSEATVAAIGSSITAATSLVASCRSGKVAVSAADSKFKLSRLKSISLVSIAGTADNACTSVVSTVANSPKLKSSNEKSVVGAAVASTTGVSSLFKSSKLKSKL